MVFDWIGTLVDDLVGCKEDDGEEGEVVPRDTADGVHEDITDGLTVPVWIFKLLGFVEG